MSSFCCFLGGILSHSLTSWLLPLFLCPYQHNVGTSKNVSCPPPFHSSCRCVDKCCHLHLRGGGTALEPSKQRSLRAGPGRSEAEQLRGCRLRAAVLRRAGPPHALVGSRELSGEPCASCERCSLFRACCSASGKVALITKGGTRPAAG